MAKLHFAKTRKFGGRTYRLHSSAGYKCEAQDVAKGLRQKGKAVRVCPFHYKGTKVKTHLIYFRG